ncbi:killer cell lectin-like receptor subfamily I member 2 [Onychomys torridus]|uniref:killer cell lectin-like receptor subfamily I member 2 n=1 Tax=Onychomys torridus TaxID=38674 RepID=UPI00167FCFDB|nr:killer cell lectin-like receptor subfamily I member 2 [Onychomys torridus]
MTKKNQSEHGTNKQETTYIGTDSSTLQEKQRLTKTLQISAMWREEQTKQELNVHRAPHSQHRTGVEVGKGLDPLLTTWRMLTFILGTSCIILVTKVGFLIPNLFSRGEKQYRESYLLALLCPKNDAEYGSCDLCSHDWVAFGNSFYHGFSGINSHSESQFAYEELNSHLIELNSKAELENMLLFEIDGWALLKTDETEVSWLWENATKIEKT